ncbi:DUF3800 domain-containing protein [Pseudomonas sp. S2_H01]
MTTIYFDESGNTGRQLGDLDQPIFILGSCDFTHAECEALLGPLRSRQAPEIHFKRLRKSGRGQDRIVELLQSPLVSPARFKAMVFNKRFMLFTKIMDDLLENLLDDLNVNFYENGQNRAFCNMLFCVLPLAVGEELFDQFLRLYYDMCLSKTEADIAAFYTHIEQMQTVAASGTLNPEFELQLLQMTQRNVRETLAIIEDSTFNPAIPAFFSLCVMWGRQYAAFDAICDDSEPVEKQSDFFALVADPRQPTEVIGHGPNSFELPLKLRSLRFTASHESDGVQATDVITSALAYYLNKKHYSDGTDEFYLKLNALNKLDELVADSIWPSLDVTPESLGRAGNEHGQNPADAMAHYIIRAEDLPR